MESTTRELIKQALKDDLKKIKGLDHGIKIVTLQQEALIYSLSLSLDYLDKIGTLPQNAKELMFSETALAMRELFPGLYGIGEMGVLRDQYYAILADVNVARAVVNHYYSQLETISQPNAEGGTKITFISSRHIRVENYSSPFPNQWAPTYVQRDIFLHSTNLGKTLTIEINPSLTAKRATLVQDKNDILTYIGDDPDFRFEIETKPDNTIRRISLFREDKDLELRFLE